MRLTAALTLCLLAVVAEHAVSARYFLYQQVYTNGQNDDARGVGYISYSHRGDEDYVRSSSSGAVTGLTQFTPYSFSLISQFTWLYQQLEALENTQADVLYNIMSVPFLALSANQQPSSSGFQQQMLKQVGCARLRNAIQDYLNAQRTSGYQQATTMQTMDLDIDKKSGEPSELDEDSDSEISVTEYYYDERYWDSEYYDLAEDSEEDDYYDDEDEIIRAIRSQLMYYDDEDELEEEEDEDDSQILDELEYLVELNLEDMYVYDQYDESTSDLDVVLQRLFDDNDDGEEEELDSANELLSNDRKSSYPSVEGDDNGDTVEYYVAIFNSANDQFSQSSASLDWDWEFMSPSGNLNWQLAVLSTLAAACCVVLTALLYTYCQLRQSMLQGMHDICIPAASKEGRTPLLSNDHLGEVVIAAKYAQFISDSDVEAPQGFKS